MCRSGLHCKDCDYSTWMLANLRTHVFRIHMKSTFSCQHCDKSFKSKAVTFSHLKESHGSSDESLIMCHCNVCAFSTDDYKSFEEHCESVHFPPGSRKRTYTRQGNDNLMETPPKIDVKEVKPSFNKRFVRRAKEINPNRERDKGQPTNIRCSLCASDARDGRDLVVHKLIAHGFCKYTCSKCDFKTRMAATMSIHGQRAHQETIKLKFACGFCPVSDKMYGMQDHMTSAHSDEFNRRMTAKLYYCNFCDFQNISERKLLRHIPIVHPDDEVVNIPEDNDDVAAIEVNKGERGITTSKKLVTAEEINAEVSKLLERQSIPGVGKQYVCKACGKSGEFSQNMRTHIETHIGNIAVPCPKCAKIFGTRSSLRSHAKKDHDINLSIIK